MDLPEGYTNSFADIFKLVEEKGVLALKPDEGSHGDGFYKFTCEDGKYQLNYKDVTKQQVLDILEDIENQYLVTEYINMCDELKSNPTACALPLVSLFRSHSVISGTSGSPSRISIISLPTSSLSA